jgi:hypothetical protein
MHFDMIKSNSIFETLPSGSWTNTPTSQFVLRLLSFYKLFGAHWSGYGVFKHRQQVVHAIGPSLIISSFMGRTLFRMIH